MGGPLTTPLNRYSADWRNWWEQRISPLIGHWRQNLLSCLHYRFFLSKTTLENANAQTEGSLGTFISSILPIHIFLCKHDTIVCSILTSSLYIYTMSSLLRKEKHMPMIKAFSLLSKDIMGLYLGVRIRKKPVLFAVSEVGSTSRPPASANM